MIKMSDYVTAFFHWIGPFVPLLCVLIYFVLESRWEAYVRKKNYQELMILNDLREKSIITQAEFDEKKEELLGV